MKTYLDTNVFVYAFVNTDVFGEQARDILDKVVRGRLKACTSFLTYDEFMWSVGKLAGRAKARTYVQEVFRMKHLECIPLDEKIVWQAHELLANEQLNPRDALHAASALVIGAERIVSEDKEFSKLGLSVVKMHELA